MSETVQQIPPGNVVHTEFISTDAAATRTWFTAVFGTRFQDMSGPQGEYHTFGDPAIGIGGAVRPLMPEEGENGYAAPYLNVEDLDATIEKAQAAGANVMVPKMPVPGMGWFAWFQAPGGVIVAAWQNDENAPAPEAPA